jgi:adenine-specific DNA-methyltransferase
MPTLEFKGKPFVYSHHLSVPFRELTLDPNNSLPGGRKASLDDNLIIHGDNLEALKALLPRYANKVDVIYIDPPYNTGGEGWAYNDNVNSPLMKEWLGRVVDRDDLQRHDKWLCMAWPRLTLLRELLSETGVIFISIDDNELHNLRCLMDEQFGDSNWVGTIVWKNVTDNNPTNISVEHEYIVCYAKDKRRIAKEWKSPISDGQASPNRCRGGPKF